MENPTTYPFVPELKDKSSLAKLTPGVWDETGDPASRMLTLANDIFVPPVIREKGKAHKIHSIPNPWAQVILFDLALEDKNGDHPLHLQTVGQWRGLLAILALREMRSFDALDTQAVQLLETDKNKLGAFSKVVSGLRPPTRSLIDPAQTWNNFHILRWRGKEPGKRGAIFGLTSPMTLVAPAANYAGAIDTGLVPWFDGTILRDPIAFLSERERQNMREWVTHVSVKIADGVRSNSKNVIIRRLNQFAEALGGQELNRDSRTFLSTETDLKLGGIFRHLSIPHNGESDTLTQLAVVGSRRVEPGVKPHTYILIDAPIAAEFDEKPGELVAFRNKSLDTMLRQPGKLTHGPLGDKAEYTWCKPSFFFEDSLIYQWRFGKKQSGQDTGPFPGCRKINQKLGTDVTGMPEIVLPLSPEVTRIFSPEYLQRNFSVEWTSDNEACCSLKVQLATYKKAEMEDGEPELVPGSERDYTIEKKYSRAEGSMLIQSLLPIVGIWPNFCYPDRDGDNRWKRYLLFESWNSLGTTEIRGDVTPNDFVVEPLPSQATQMPKRMINLKSINDGHEQNDVFQISPMNRFPEFLVVRMPAGSSAPKLREGRPPQGLLMLTQPLTPPAADKGKALLGIDFGTTGSAIYCVYGADQRTSGRTENPKPIVFKNRFFPVTLNRDPREFERLSRQLFIPGKDWPVGKILSLLQDFGSVTSETPRLAMRDAHVVFADPIQTGTLFLGAPDSIRSNFKWGETERDTIATKDFLTQLCLQSVAELVCEGAQSVEVRASYPTAFSENDIWKFHTNWRTVMSNLKGRDEPESVTTVPVTFTEGDDTQNHEAIAATRYFSKMHKLAYASGALTFDIGGGTTDLALWNMEDNDRDAKLLAHLSVRFAGRDLFREPVSRRPEILDMISGKGLSFLLKESNTGAKNAQLDAIVAAEGDALIAKLTDKEGDSIVTAFLSLLELGLCGLAFYSGLVIGRSIARGKFTPGPKIPVFVGGNGSKLLKWCAFGNFSARSPIHKRFEKSLLAGVQVAVPGFTGTAVSVTTSEHAKEEVAFGLVAREEMPIDLTDAFTDQIEGEDFRVMLPAAPASHHWDESLKTSDLIDYPVRPGDKMAVFSSFLASLDPSSQDFELDAEALHSLSARLTTKIRSDAEDEVRIRARERSSKTLNSLRREPLFFMALQDLLGQRVAVWEEMKNDSHHD